MKTPSASDFGIVYLLVNECMPGLVKIGKTSRKKLEMRMRELYTTGVPLPFECAYACRVKLAHMDELEKALHTAFAPHRVNDAREFFRLSVSQAVPLLKLMTALNEGDATEEVASEIAAGLAPEEKEAVKKSKGKRPPLDYFALGLSVGDVLTFDKNTSVSCSVASARKVMYQGEERSLTAVTTALLGSKWAVQPTPFWSVNGRNLRDLYDEKFPFEDE